jgi:hypothetical protein
MFRVSSEQPPTSNIPLKEWLSRLIVNINGAISASGNLSVVRVGDEDVVALDGQVLICKNTADIDVILNPNAVEGAHVHIKRRGAGINVIGTIDGLVNMYINVDRYSMHLYFDGEDWSEI